MVRCLVVVGILAAFGVAIAGAAGKGVGRVTILDRTLTPVVVKVGVRSDVVWTNRGLHKHRIASTTSAWPPFVLAKGKSKAVTFRKEGSYPYRVDGKRPGVVLVLTSLGATSTSDSFFKRYHYKVTIHVVTHTDFADKNGTDVQDVEWRGTWPDVVVRAGVNGNEIVISTTRLAAGQIDAQDNWSHSDPTTGGPCGDTFQDSAPAKLFLQGLVHPPGSHSFRAQFLTSPADDFHTKVVQQQQGECKGFASQAPPSWNLGDLSLRLHAPSELTADPVEELLTLQLENTKAPTPYPIDLLAHGDSFQFQTEPFTLQRNSGGVRVSGKAEVSVVFTARP